MNYLPQRLYILAILICLMGNISVHSYFGFKTINILNLKDNTKCSGLVLNTEYGCKAVTNAHCVKNLAIGEENIYIAPIKRPKMSTPLAQEFFLKTNLINIKYMKTSLIKAKPSSDLAQIDYKDEWSPSFCSHPTKLNSQNTVRFKHLNEVYTAQQRRAPGPVNQHDPHRSRSPNPSTLYRSRQNHCVFSSGYQNGNPTLLSLGPIDYNSLSVDENGLISCPTITYPETWRTMEMKTRVNVEYSSLPGLEYMYQVQGINLSQGMSGGALISLTNSKNLSLKLEGMAASFYPYQWLSNFIPTSYILDFVNNYEDNLIDKHIIELTTDNAQVVSDNDSQRLSNAIKQLIKEGKLSANSLSSRDNSTLPPMRISDEDDLSKFYLSTQKLTPILNDINKNPRIPRGTTSADTDQDDVGDDILQGKDNCKVIKSKIDPYYDYLPPVTNCFDLSQTRFQHTGVIIDKDKSKLAIAYKDEQINGRSDLRQIISAADFSSDNIIYRNLGEYPSVDIRKSILASFKGIYHKSENNSYWTQGYNAGFHHLNENFTKQYTIAPSGNALLNESLLSKTKITNKVLDNKYNHKIINNLYNTHALQTMLKVGDQSIEMNIKLVDGHTYQFTMIPIFSSDYKNIELKTSLRIVNKKFTDITKEITTNTKFSLTCDNRNFLKLICSHKLMEFGLSKPFKTSRKPTLRVSFWNGFVDKYEAQRRDKFQMHYIFGRLQKRSSQTTRNPIFSYDFDKMKLKELLNNTNYEYLNINSLTVLDKVLALPRKVKRKMKCEILKMSSKSFIFKEELFHLIHSRNESCKKRRPYGVLYDRLYNVIGVLINGKLSTDAHDIF